MKIFLTTLLSFFSLTSFCQKQKSQIMFCPLCLVDEITFPTIQGGFEFSLSERLSLYNEAGIKYREGYYETSDTSFINSKGFKVKSELRYYFSFAKQQVKNTYVAINWFYNKDTHNTTIEYYRNNDSSISFIDNFGVKKSVTGFNILIGGKKKLSKRFSVDIYAGLGLRFVNVVTNNKEFNTKSDQLQSPVDVTVVGSRDRIDAFEKADNVGNFTLGIRICYYF